MPPWDVLLGQPVAVVFALVTLYLLNRNYADSLREKKEVIELIRSERAEWIKREAQMQDRLLSVVQASTEAQVRTQSEIHQLRSWTTRWTLNIEHALRTGREIPPAPDGGDRNE